VKVKRRRPFFFLDGEPLSLSAVDLARFKLFGMPPSNESSRLKTQDDLTRVIRRDRIVEVEEVRKQIKRYRCVIPVLDYDWENHDVDDLSLHGITLAKRLAQTASLVHLPQTHDLQTKKGVRATYGTAFHPQEFNNSEKFFFIRETILRSILQKHGWSLVWAVWGERELSHKQLERARPGGDLMGLSHGDFRAVHIF